MLAWAHAAQNWINAAEKDRQMERERLLEAGYPGTKEELEEIDAQYQNIKIRQLVIARMEILIESAAEEACALRYQIGDFVIITKDSDRRLEAIKATYVQIEGEIAIIKQNPE